MHRSRVLISGWSSSSNLRSLSFLRLLLCLLINLLENVFSESLCRWNSVHEHIWLRGRRGTRLVCARCCHSRIHCGRGDSLTILRFRTKFASFPAMSVWLPSLLNVVNICFLFFNDGEYLRIIWSSLAMEFSWSLRVLKHRHIFSSAEISIWNSIAWPHFCRINPAVINMIIISDRSKFIRINSIKVVYSACRASYLAWIKPTIFT